MNRPNSFFDRCIEQRRPVDLMSARNSQYRCRSGGPASASRRPRRQDGASLRRSTLPRSLPSSLVVPVVRTGLHCGVDEREGRVSRGDRRPRRQDGASLRLDDLEAALLRLLSSSPSSGRGFIAAGRFRRGCGPSRRSSPSSGRGFIAAMPSRSDRPRCWPVVPVVRTGLHCGPDRIAPW